MHISLKFQINDYFKFVKNSDLTNLFCFCSTGTQANVFNSLKPIPTICGGEFLTFENHQFVYYLMRNDVTFYRCIRHPLNCRMKIRVMAKSNQAEVRGNHNHEVIETFNTIESDPNKKIPSLESTKKDFLFNKDVTSGVELILNDRDVALMFLNGYKFTKYFEYKSRRR